MSAPRYEQPAPASADEVRAAIRGEDDREVADLLVGAALHDPDLRAVQDLCLDLLAGPDRDLAAVAAACLGHLARIHGTLDTDRVVPALTAARHDPTIGPRADDALDDLETFLDITIDR